MQRALKIAWYGVITALALWASGIVPAIIPSAVPTPNKRGNSNIFQLATSATPAAAGTVYCDDGSGNTTTSGCSTGGAGTPGATLFSATTTVGPDDTNVETSLIGTVTGSKTIAANTFTNGAILESRVQGYITLPLSPDSLTIKVYCGSTALASISYVPVATSADNVFTLWLMFTARGSGGAGSIITNGYLQPNAVQNQVFNASPVAFDFTTSCAFDIKAKWNAAQVGETVFATNAAAWFPGAPATKQIYTFSATVTSTGQLMLQQVPQACTIFGWSAIADPASASGTFSAELDAVSNSAPPGVPVVPNTTTNKISASAPVAFSSAQAASGGATAISTWTPIRAQWDSFALNVTSFTSLNYVNVSVWCQ